MPTISTSVPTDGNYIAQWIPAISGPNGCTVAEWNAGKDLTYYFTPDGWTPGGDQATVTDDRLTAPQVFEQPGKVTDTLDTVYVINPQSPTDDVAELTLIQNVAGFIGVRKAMPHDTAVAAAQKVTIYPIKCGVQRDLTPEANGVFKKAQKQFITNNVRREVAVLA
jgi:hypothetical protein